MRPAWILGAVPDAAMNICYPLAVYAIVCKHLGQPLAFPSGVDAWDAIHAQSSAMLNAYLEEWCVLTDAAKNEAFNATDDVPFSWGKMWPKLASWYGLPYEKPNPKDDYLEFDTPYDPPPRGFGPPAKIRVKFSLVEWAKQPEVQKAWEELGLKYKLANHQLTDPDRMFGTPEMALASSFSSYLRFVAPNLICADRCG